MKGTVRLLYRPEMWVLLLHCRQPLLESLLVSSVAKSELSFPVSLIENLNNRIIFLHLMGDSDNSVQLVETVAGTELFAFERLDERVEFVPAHHGASLIQPVEQSSRGTASNPGAVEQTPAGEYHSSRKSKQDRRSEEKQGNCQEDRCDNLDSFGVLPVYRCPDELGFAFELQSLQKTQVNMSQLHPRANEFRYDAFPKAFLKKLEYSRIDAILMGDGTRSRIAQMAGKSFVKPFGESVSFQTDCRLHIGVNQFVSEDAFEASFAVESVPPEAGINENESAVEGLAHLS